MIPVIVRGGGYESEWAGNFNVYGSQTHHEGFRIASETVYSELKDYIRNSHITGKVNFWLTGYSRAGATANLVAAYIDDDISSSLCRQYNIEFNKRNVYAYTFEAPRNTKDQNTQYDKYGNIYNIINPVDLVPLVGV